VRGCTLLGVGTTAQLAVETNDLTSADAFVRAWMTYESELRRFATRVLSDRRRAEVAVHDAFLRAGQRRASFDAMRLTQRAWLFAILRNVIIDGAHNDVCGSRLAALNALRDAIDELGHEQ
jgi:RNA polymerase sigma-70 factor (ECF subfamily)